MDTRTLRNAWERHCRFAGQRGSHTGKNTSILLLAIMRESTHQARAHAQWKKEWNDSSTGAHLQQIDDTLPAKYTRRLYAPCLELNVLTNAAWNWILLVVNIRSVRGERESVRQHAVRLRTIERTEERTANLAWRYLTLSRILPKHCNDLKVAHHEGCITTTTAQRPWQVRRGSGFA
ncbi:hypothetical protein E8E15_001145 [Penicillium rubens]|jgi:hypothetical protein|nr:hypothetical protein E8E15_001145 [Penicillium rubens]